MASVIRRTVTILLGGMLLLGSIGIAAAKTEDVKAKGNKWKPLHTYIGKGDKVIWKNPTGKVHDLKAYGGGWNLSEVLSPGETKSKKFKKLGTFKYRCVRHSGLVNGACDGMCGLVHVVP